MDGRVLRGERTRHAVLDEAVALATEAGLDGLSLSQLADRLSVSKSGLFAHWRTKGDLQIAAVAHAQRQWTTLVVSPALKAPRGVRRLWALHEARLAFYADNVLPGGCFFASSQFEFDARPGPVRDALAAAKRDWLGLVRRLATEAVELGELRPDIDAEQIAFEVDALGMATVHQARLLGADETYTRARRAVLLRLRMACTNPYLLPEE